MSKQIDIYSMFQDWQNQKAAASELERSEATLSATGISEGQQAVPVSNSTTVKQAVVITEAGLSSLPGSSSIIDGGYTHDKGQTLTFENVRIDFPLKPYAAQVQMMKNIIHSINNSENALLESPTGSGKSLALLCAALAWRENEERKATEEMADRNNKSAVKAEGVKMEKKDIIQIYSTSSSTMIEIPDDTQHPIKTIDKRELEVVDENRPENWAKKFKLNPTDVVMVEDDDSFDDDFQKPLQPAKSKKLNAYHDENIPPPSPSPVSAAQSSAIPATTYTETENTTKPESYRKIPRIFVGSRTHKQITQLISELKKKTRYNPRTTILGSRDHLCIHPIVSKTNNKTEECVALLDKSACSFSQRTHALITHPSLQNNHVWDIEDMVKLGKKVKGCPYYASRKLYDFAEVIFCPYNYIIDPVIRKILDINLKDSIVILDEAHNIEDSSRSAGSFVVDEKTLYIVKKELEVIIRNGHEREAHELIEVLIESLYNWMTAEDNDFVIREFDSQYCHWTGAKLINKLNAACITANIFNSQLKPAYRIASAFADQIRKEKERQALGEETEQDMTSSQVQIHQRKCLSDNSLKIIQGIFLVLGYLFQEGKNYADDYQMVLTKRIERPGGGGGSGRTMGRRLKNELEPEWSFKLAFKCMNPGIIFRDMSETTRSVILTSGTLSPLNTFAGELETKFEGRLEANHVINKSQVWVGGIMKGPSGVSLKGVFSNIESFEYQDDIGQALCDIVEMVPHGVLCFMSSYNTLDKLMERWKAKGLYDRLAAKKLIFTEPRGSDKNEFESVIDKFYKQIDKVRLFPDQEGRDGALFFAVFRGKVSEGIDFTDEYCRAVVTVGIPFPAIKDMDVKFKKEYNDMRRAKNRNSEVLSSNEWYSAQAFRAINQALGRCIRHKNDWGAIVLLENRFAEGRNVQSLSKWVRNQYKNHNNYNHALSDLKEFINRQSAKSATSTPSNNPIIAAPQATYVETHQSITKIPAPQTHNQITTPQTVPYTVQHTLSYTHSASSAVKAIELITNHPSHATTNTTSNMSPYFSAESSKSTNTNDDLEDLQIISSSILSQKNYSLSYVSKVDILKPSLMHSLQGENMEISKEEEDEDDLPLQILGESVYFGDTSKEKELAPAPQFKAPNPISTTNSWQPKTLYDFKALEPPHITRNNLRQIGPYRDSRPVSVSCLSCGGMLMEGPKNKLIPTEIDDLTLITKKLDSPAELLGGEWKTGDCLQGGPLNVNDWPVESTVTFNSQDRACYRFLNCACDISKSIGVVVVQCFDKNQNHRYQGCVFVCLDRLRIARIVEQTTPTMTTNASTMTQAGFPEKYDFDFESSQMPNMNDYFYSL